MSNERESFLCASATLAAILVIASVVFKPENPLELRYAVYVSYIVAVVIFTIIAHFLFKDWWRWEGKERYVAGGILISYIWFVIRNDHPEPGLREAWVNGVHRYWYTSGNNEMPLVYYFIMLLMLGFLMFYYIEFLDYAGVNKKVNPQLLEEPPHQPIYEHFAMQIYGKPFDQLTDDQKEKLKK